jgi:tetratricopeptide (TPR) repeat protein
MEARGFKGEEDRLTCLGCHNHHPTNKNYKYLRWSADGGENKTKFCVHCHPDKNLPDRVFDMEEYSERLKAARNIREKANPAPPGDPYLAIPAHEIKQLHNTFRGATHNLNKYDENYHKKKLLTDEEISRMRAEEFFLQGRNASEQGDTEQAIRYFELSMESSDDINRTNEIILLALGRAYLKNSMFDQAKNMFNRVLIVKHDLPEAHFELGKIHKRNKNTDDAVYHFMRTAKLKPNYPQVYLNLGIIYLKDKAFINAREMFEKALRLNPDSAEALTGLGECFLLEKDYKAAVDTFKKALLRQETASAYLGLGKAYLKSETSGALEVLKKGAAIDRKNPVILHHLAMAYAAENLLEKSLKTLGKAAQLKEDYAEVRYETGKIYLAQEKYKESEQSLKKALDIRPDYAEAYVELGRVYYRQQELSLAIDAYQKAIQLQPGYSEIINDLEKTLVAQCDNNVSGCIHLGDFYLTRKNYKKAITPFRKVVKADPQNVRAYLGLGDAQMKLKLYADARSSFEDARKLAPNSPEALYNLGILLRNLGKEKEWRSKLSQAVVLKYLEDNPGKSRIEAGDALRYDTTLLYRTAVKISPDDPDTHNSLGTAYMVKGKYDSAVSEYERALKLRPNFPDYLYNIGLAAGSGRNYKRSENAYRSLLHIMPEHFQAAYNLGKVYRDQGMLDKAIKEYRKILPLRPGTINLSLGHLYRTKWEKKQEREWLILSESHFKKALAESEDDMEAKKNLAFVQNLLAGKIQAMVINTPDRDRIKKIAKMIKRRMNPDELKEIARRYGDESEIGFTEEETLGKKLWKDLTGLKAGESSRIIFHRNRYFLLYRMPPGL